MYFPKYRLRKILLDKYLKSCVSEDHEKNNMGNTLKHCCNLNGSSFSVFIKYFVGRCVGESLF